MAMSIAEADIEARRHAVAALRECASAMYAFGSSPLADDLPRYAIAVRGEAFRAVKNAIQKLMALQLREGRQ